MANIVINNDLELMVALNEIVNEVMPPIQKEISEELDRNILGLIYYLDYFPNHYYLDKTGQPSWQFRYAFKWKDEPISNAGVSKILYYDWQSLSYRPEIFMHGSPQGGDARENLADILNIEGYDSGLFGGKLRGAFWKNTMDDLLSGTIENWFKKAFAGYNIIKT